MVRLTFFGLLLRASRLSPYSGGQLIKGELMLKSLSCCLSLCAFMICVAAAPLHAQVSADRPGKGGPPTPVTVTTRIVDIAAIDNVKQQFTVDIFMSFSWVDPRLALAGASALGEGRVLGLNDLWMPTITAANSRDMKTRLPEQVVVDDFGNVTYAQRFFGNLAVDMEFKQFPFDEQILSVDLISYGHTIDELQILNDADGSGMSNDFSAEDWVFSTLPVDNKPFKIVGQSRQVPKLSIRIKAQREASYYLVTMMLPMSLVLFMAWTVFWLPPSVVAPRIAVSTASIFSLLALGFSMRLNLPAVAYITRVDWFILGSTLMVFGALGVAVIGSRLSLRGMEAAAERLNLLARWAYPLLFGITILIAGFI